jgi:hypothetical protein
MIRGGICLRRYRAYAPLIDGISRNGFDKDSRFPNEKLDFIIDISLICWNKFC